MAKEQRWKEQIVDSLLVGDAIKLKAGDTEFLGLYAEATSDNVKGAVIILHGVGAHPAWPDVIEPLRMQLPDLGWHTLSLQMPVLDNEATIKDYPPLFPEVPGRIQVGVDFLKNKGVKNIVISGHSLGNTMASYYLAKHRDPVVKTFVSISGGFGVPDNKLMDNNSNFMHINDLYILDIYGGEDHKPVIEAVKLRGQIAKKVRKAHYQQLKVSGANHFYHNKLQALIKILNTELSKIE